MQALDQVQFVSPKFYAYLSHAIKSAQWLINNWNCVVLPYLKLNASRL